MSTVAFAAESPGSAPPRYLTAAVCCILAAMVWAVFGQTRHFEFTNFDDPDYVYDNPLTNQGLTWHNVIRAFTQENRREWVPVTYVSRMVDSQIYGLEAGGHHVTNVLLHGATAILLFLVLRKMTGALGRAAFAAAVFAIHPLRVQSVAWVVERKDVLSGVFFMLALWAWTDYVAKRPGAGERADSTASVASREWLPHYVAALAFFVLGLLSKPTVVTLPLILLLLDYWPFRRLPAQGGLNSWRRLVGEKLPFFLASAAGCVVTMRTQSTVIHAAQHTSFSWRIGNVLYGYVDYLWHMVYPAGLALVYPYAPANQPLVRVVLCAMLLLAISGGAVWARRRHPYLLVGWLWYLGMLLPVIDSMAATQNCRADRYTYLPQIGICILTVWGATALASHWRRGRPALGLAAGIVLGALLVDSHGQTRYWKDSVTIWTRTIECTPDNYFAENSLGSALSNQEKWKEAIPHLERAVRFKPDCVEAHANYGIALADLGRSDEAMQQFEEALQLNPNAADASYALGKTLADRGRTAEAIKYLSEAVRLKPDQAQAQYDLALALASEEKWDEATVHYDLALHAKLDPAGARYVTGMGMASHGKWEQASELYAQALQAKPDFAEAHYRLGIALSKLGQPAAATEHFQSALMLATNQGNADLAQSVRAQLGAAPTRP